MTERSGMLVLIVDSGLDSIEDLRALLAGHRLVSARSIDEACDIVAGGRVDVVLVGSSFATQGGVRDAAAIFDADADVEVVLVAETVSTALLRSALHAGLADVIDAPATLAKLEDAFERAADRSAKAFEVPHVDDEPVADDDLPFVATPTFEAVIEDVTVEETASPLFGEDLTFEFAAAEPIFGEDVEPVVVADVEPAEVEAFAPAVEDVEAFVDEAADDTPAAVEPEIHAPVVGAYPVVGDDSPWALPAVVESFDASAVEAVEDDGATEEAQEDAETEIVATEFVANEVTTSEPDPRVLDEVPLSAYAPVSEIFEMVFASADETATTEPVVDEPVSVLETAEASVADDDAAAHADETAESQPQAEVLPEPLATPPPFPPVAAVDEAGDDAPEMPMAPPPMPIREPASVLEPVLSTHTPGEAVEAPPQIRPRSLAGDGHVIAVTSGKGGSGKTVTATNLATSLSEILGPDRVAIFDADLQFGDVALLLQLEPTRTILDVLAEPSPVSDEKFDALMLRHETGLRVLPAPLLPQAPETIAVDDVLGIIERLKQMYDIVVVDTGPVFGPTLDAVLGHADSVVMVVDMDLPSVKNAKIALDGMRGTGFPLDRVHLVVNRVNSKARLDLVELERSLGLRVSGSIPSDRLVPQSVNEGVPAVLLSPRSRLARSFAALADRFVPEQVRRAS